MAVTQENLPRSKIRTRQLEQTAMSMHLEGPWLSTTGKKKTKRKFASAAHAAKARELDESWKALMIKYGPAKVAPAPKRQTLEYKLEIPAERNNRLIPSRDSGLGNATKLAPKVYTGDKIVGIATMHKSNMVPVFSNQEAEDISKMRRG
jgi:hypothetical protein